MAIPSTPKQITGLQGRHILMTRPADSSGTDEFDRQFIAHGATVSHLPLVEIHPVVFSWEPALAFDWWFFTSQNAVRQFLAKVAGLPHTPVARLAAVGPATAECIQSFGFPVSYVSPEYNAESAAKSFCSVYDCAGLRVLWPCGNLANPALQEILHAAGAIVSPLAVYQTDMLSLLSPAQRQLLESDIDMVVFTSPSAVEAWAALNDPVKGKVLPQAPIACLGPKTAQAALRRIGHVEVQASPATLPALAQAIINYFKEGNTA